ncbi:MAG: stage III sporulation protein AB [Eubacteriales bacterium]|nr:stage III sporulation protein AB [Eubacteriales bacterium]
MEVKQDKAYQQALTCLTPLRAAQLAALEGQGIVEELRLRAGRPPAVKTAAGERALDLAAVTPQELRETLSRAARYSVHSYTESLKNGFVPLSGGHRLGLCGTVAAENGQVIGVRGLSSVNLRVARQIEGVGDEIAPWVGDGPPRSVLLLSPPGYGKTTLLREWVRLVSDKGYTVAVADERSEIAALSDGVPQFEVGRCTDVLEACGKKQAALMLLKTMSPALLAFDEITAPEDVEAVSLCAHCGTAVLASAHAEGVEDLAKRPLYRALLELHLFERAVVIGRKDGGRSYRMVRLEGGAC